MSIRKRTAKLLRRVRNAYEAGSVEQLRRARWRYLTSMAARYCAAEKALRRLLRGRPADERVCALAEDQVRALAAEINPYHPTGERVFARPEPKRTGGYRMVCSFGARERAIQYLIKPLLEICGGPREHQYGLDGKSRDDLINMIRDKIETGYTYAVLLDVANCFGSFCGEAVVDRLPLPRRVVESHVTFHRLEVRYRSRRSRSVGSCPSMGNAPSSATPLPGALRPMVLDGIPQGSAVSNLVAASMLADLDTVVPVGTPFGQYGDDIIALAMTEEEACSIRDALRHALNGHVSGSISLKRLAVSHIADGFEYLGYWFSGTTGEVHILPGGAKLAAFRQRWIGALREDYAAGRYHPVEAAKVARDFVQGYRAATGLRGFCAVANFKASYTLLVSQTVRRKPSMRTNPFTSVRSA